MALRRAVFGAVCSLTAFGCAGVHTMPGSSGGGGADGGSPPPLTDAQILGTNSDVPAYEFGPSSASDAEPMDRVVGSKPLGDAACAVETQKAERIPLDMYVMLDSSSSMFEPTMTNGPAKWDAVKMALTSFIQDPGSAGLGVGLQYFPITRAGVPDQCDMTSMCGAAGGMCNILNTCTGVQQVTPCVTAATCGRRQQCVRLGVCALTGGACIPVGSACIGGPTDTCLAIGGYCMGRDLCEPAPYAAPAVEVATLPAAAPALIASLTQKMPDGLTPTAGALSGAITHAQALAKAAAGHQVVVVLATDGFPSECTPSDIPGVAGIAARGLTGAPAIQTFVIGVFAQDEAVDAQMNLDAIAAAGGTKKAFVVSSAQNVSTQFLAALNSIRTAALSCEFKVPAAKAGEKLDYFKVNVQYTPGTGQAVTIGNVANRAACSATKGGWFYDVDPNTGATPQNITICDTTCSQLRGDPVGRVDVLLGCQTEIIIP